MSQESDGTLRDFLDRRERELTEKATKLRNELAPYEAELADIRRAKVALGYNLAGMLTEFLQDASSPNDAATRAGNIPAGGMLAGNPFERITIKGLAVKALDEKFRQGATAQQLLEFFRDAWGRDIDRASLSPQLSRLQEEGSLMRTGNKYMLVPEAISEHELKAWGVIPAWATAPPGFKRDEEEDEEPSDAKPESPPKVTEGTDPPFKRRF